MDSPPDSPTIPEKSAIRVPTDDPARVTGNATTARRPCNCNAKGRNLVVCIDGTSNQFSQKNTNIVELYSRLVKGSDTQITFYNSGIGTYAKPSWRSWSYYKQVVGHKIDLAIAWRFERILLSAYLWLSENYKIGDRIFLFGFSRGAYQVRALSAMIDAVGLIHKGNQDQIPFAYQLYAETKAVDQEMQRRFKTTFSWEDVTVHFVGAWDTVSSVGVVRDKNLPGTADGMQHACYFRHALALHERRVKFLPEYVRGGSGPEVDPADDPKMPHTKEVWFAGSHSDIGGGARENSALDRFGPSLRWMSCEATQLGLQLKVIPYKWKESQISESMTASWKLLEYLPIRRLSFHGAEHTTSKPHLGRKRVIQTAQLIHESVSETITQDDPWSADIESYSIEADPYAAAKRVFGAVSSTELPDLAAMSFLTGNEFGRQSLRDIETELQYGDRMLIAPRLLTSLSVKFAQDGYPKADIPSSAVKAVRTVITIVEALQQRVAPSILRPVARALATHSNALAHELMAKLSNPGLRAPLRGHTSAVNSVAFLSDTRLVSASDDTTLHIWDIVTGETVIGPLQGHTQSVRCVAVHGSRFASCSFDGTFRVWDAYNGKLLLGPITAHNGEDVNCVAYSRDGTRIATAGDDNRVVVWDANSGAYLREMVGHTDPVMCVAFSKDGTRLASGSQDKTVRIWDVASGECVGQQLIGHTSWITAVCFSPDNKRIFSSVPIRIWDAATRALIFEPLQSDHFAMSMALSPDGKRLVSGSSSGHIATWDAWTGAAIPTPFRGHEGRIQSMAFSPDGRKIASASRDMTIGLWDATDNWKRYDIDDEGIENDDV